jgi:hypothetical protein
MNRRAQARLQQIERERIELTKYLDAPQVTQEDRAAIASRLRELLDETEKLNSGEHGLRGNTTAESQDLYELVQRAISAERVMKQ